MPRTPLCLLLVALVAVGGCGRLRNQPAVTPPVLDPANPESGRATPEPAAAKAPYVAVAEEFFQRLSKHDMARAYDLLTEHYRSLVPEQDFAGLFGDISIKRAQTVNSAGSANVGYVVMAITLAKPVASGPDVTGYSVLMKKVQDQWQVALFLAEEKLAGTYNDLLIIPAAKGKGYIVTYTDENGKQTRFDVQEP
jgi:hypothetical protein